MADSVEKNTRWDRDRAAWGETRLWGRRETKKRRLRSVRSGQKCILRIRVGD